MHGGRDVGTPKVRWLDVERCNDQIGGLERSE